MSAARRSKDPEIRRTANREWRQRHKALCRRKEQARRKRRRAEGKPVSKGKVRAQQLRKFGITEQEYDRMFTAQDGHCAICPDGPQPNRRLAVDHCHETSRIRGLLCARCNLGLGFFRDSEDLLLNAIGYLQ